MRRHGPHYRVPFRRRREGRTDYRRRLQLLKSELPRAVVRKTNTGMVVQVYKYTDRGDEIVASAVANELKKLGWQEADLSRHRKGDPGKLGVALRLRAETTMTLAWTAHRLQMGTKTHLSHLLYWRGRKRTKTRS